MCPYLKTMKVRENKHSCEASLVPNDVFSVSSVSKCSTEDYDTCPVFLACELRALARPTVRRKNKYGRAA